MPRDFEHQANYYMEPCNYDYFIDTLYGGHYGHNM